MNSNDKVIELLESFGYTKTTLNDDSAIYSKTWSEGHLNTVTSVSPEHISSCSAFDSPVDHLLHLERLALDELNKEIKEHLQDKLSKAESILRDFLTYRNVTMVEPRVNDYFEKEHSAVNLEIDDYIEGTEHFGQKTRKVRGWVDRFYSDGDCISIQADDEFHGARSTLIMRSLGEVKKLEKKRRL